MHCFWVVCVYISKSLHACQSSRLKQRQSVVECMKCLCCRAKQHKAERTSETVQAERQAHTNARRMYVNSALSNVFFFTCTHFYFSFNAAAAVTNAVRCGAALYIIFFRFICILFQFFFCWIWLKGTVSICFAFILIFTFNFYASARGFHFVAWLYIPTTNLCLCMCVCDLCCFNLANSNDRVFLLECS